MSPYRVLVVCTGNVCRSPLTELALKQQLANVPTIEVFSAGTHALVGRGMEPENIAIAEQNQIWGARDHVAQRLSAAQVNSADLVLTLAREHRRYVVERVPAATRRTFTLREFARLALLLPASQHANDLAKDVFGRTTYSFVDKMVAQRGMVSPLANPTADDVIDPYRLGHEIFIRQSQEIFGAVGIVADLLRANLRET